MTPAAALSEIYEIADTIREHLDALDIEARYVEEESTGVARETHNAIADDLASIRRAVAAIKLQIRLADEAEEQQAEVRQ